MTRENGAKLLPALTHWVKGGRLWWYDEGIWKEYKAKSLFFNADDKGNSYIIEDEFFDARKAFVEGKVVEYCSVSSGIWATCPNPLFNKGFRYRVKTPSPRELYKQRFDQALTHLLGSYSSIGLTHLEKIDKCTRMANIYAIKSDDDILNLRLIKGIMDGGKKITIPEGVKETLDYDDMIMKNVKLWDNKDNFNAVCYDVIGSYIGIDKRGKHFIEGHDHGFDNVKLYKEDEGEEDGNT